YNSVMYYAHISFNQFILYCNTATTEETFWYVQRETGSWWDIGLVLIFGHFLLPFLMLLRIDTKLSLPAMIPLCVWGWMMHFCDMSFNIMPVLHSQNFNLHWLDLGCLAFFAGVLSLVFIRYFWSHAACRVEGRR